MYDRFDIKSIYFSDPAMKQYLLHLDEIQDLGKSFVIMDLDNEHLFIEPDVMSMLKDKIDDLLDSLSFPYGEGSDQKKN